MNYLLPLLLVILGYVIALLLKPKKKKNVKLLLAFSGSFLLSITVMHLLPEVYETHSHSVGIFIMVGILANWLIKSLDQRARTILKLASEIVRQQDGFFVHGVRALRPLNLKTVADAVEMHESTVSRVTSNKYVSTPRGVFELKYFFSASIPAVQGGESHSAESVRHRIKEMIDQESREAVLSDDQIVERLACARHRHCAPHGCEISGVATYSFVGGTSQDFRHRRLMRRLRDAALSQHCDCLSQLSNSSLLRC